MTTTYILYIFLSYFRRINDYETLGGLFADMKDEMTQKNVAEQLWSMFDELLDIVISASPSLDLLISNPLKNPKNTNILRVYLRHLF